MEQVQRLLGMGTEYNHGSGVGGWILVNPLSTLGSHRSEQTLGTYSILKDLHLKSLAVSIPGNQISVQLL